MCNYCFISEINVHKCNYCYLPEVCDEDEHYNSGKCLLSTFLLSVREIHESFAPLKHMQNTELVREGDS